MNKQSGQLSLYVLIFGVIAVILLSGLIIWVDLNLKSTYRQSDNFLALSVAEAGIEYYRWHLAHSPGDYQDGTGNPGPYEHEYYDKSGNLIGRFMLDITPPPVGSSVVIIKSTGKIERDSSVEKIIEATMAIPSITQYAVVANSNMRFGPGTETFGKIHVNGGVRFDGLAHNIVSSDRQTYDDPDHSGSNEYAVHTHLSPVDPLPPNSLLNRPDVFESGRQLSAPAVDFDGLTADFAQFKSDAQTSGIYFDNSGNEGYHIVLKTNDTFDIYRVTQTASPPSGCYNLLNQQDWGTWSIDQEELVGNFAFPSNGLIFIEDNVWVDGQISTAQISIAAARLPENPGTYKNITVNNDLLYTNYDGQDIIALVSQNNMNIGMVSEDDLRIDAVIIAKNGRAGRYYYRPPFWIWPRCSPYHDRQQVFLHGMIATNKRYGFAYTDNTGYDIRSLNYDPSLLFVQPPGLPTSAGTHEVIRWQEVK